MNLNQLLDTMRGLTKEALTAKDAESVAVQTAAVTQLFHILDVMASAGHSLPSAWTFASPERGAA